MMKIEIDGKFLDLPIDASVQSERNTPLLLGDEILGEYTYPLLLPATENNCRIFGFITELGALKTVKEVRKGALLYEWDILTARGTLVAEYVEVDLNHPEAGAISVFFLMSISDFYSQANKVLLRDLNLGGERKIKQFTQHAMATWYGTSDRYDYVFAPVANVEFKPQEDVEDYNEEKDPTGYFMNGVTFDIDPNVGTGLQFANFRYSYSRRVPLMYLRYLLLKCFEYFGYTVSGELIDDKDFKKVILLNYQSVYWGYISKRAPTGWRMIELPEVVINLSNHVPKDYSVTKFLIAFSNLWGITYMFDPLRKHCTLYSLNKLTQTGKRIDLTSKISPGLRNEFVKEAKVYALKFEIDGGDSRINRPDLSQYRRLKDVDAISQAQTAGEQYENAIVLARKINWFYKCTYSTEDKGYSWIYFCDNIYDYIPSGSNTDITTAMAPVGTVHHDWMFLAKDNYGKALFPAVTQEGNWMGKKTGFANWGLRVLFYHGMQPDYSGNPGFYYPFASSHNYNSIGQQVSSYSLCFNVENDMVGRFWKHWLDILGSMEVVSLSYKLSFSEYLNLNWTDLLLVKNVLYLNIQHTPTIPFTGTLALKALRIGSNRATANPCVAAVVSITVSYTDGDFAMVDFTENPTGSSAWEYTLDDGFSVTVTTHPFRLPVSPGAHKITITPMCGEVPNSAGAFTQSFVIPNPIVRITLKAELTTGQQPFNKMVLIAKASMAPNVPAEAWRFNFGQCVVNTSIPGSHYCNGYNAGNGIPGIIQFRPLVAAVSAQSGNSTPGANFGYITKVIIWGIYSPKYKLQIEKAPGENWELEVNP